MQRLSHPVLPSILPPSRRALVQKQPIEAELADGVYKLSEVDGFADVAIGAEPVAFQAVALLVGGGENDHRPQPSLSRSADTPKHLEPVNLGQLRIEDDHLGQRGDVAACIRAGPEQVVQSLCAVSRHHDFIRNVVLPKCSESESLIIRIVFY